MLSALTLPHIILLIFLIAEIGLLLYTALTWRRDRVRTIWLGLTIIPIIVVTAAQFLPADWQFETIVRGFVIWVALIATAILYGGMIFHDIARDDKLPRLRGAWLILSLAWSVAFILTALTSQPPFTGWSQWITNFPGLPALIGTIGAIMYSLFLLGVTFYYFYIAPMAEVANRAAFWTVTTGIMLVSVSLLASSSEPLMLAGTVVLYSALSIATYGIRHYRIIDIRDTILFITRTMAFVVVVWAFIFATFYFTIRLGILDTFNIPTDNRGTLLLAGIALAVTVMIVPARQIIEIIFKKVVMRTRPNLATATAQYSQRVARAASLEEVVSATTETLNKIMGVRRSALILINNTYRVTDAVELVVMEAGSTIEAPTAIGYLTRTSPIYRSLAVEKVPIGQFDIEYGPAYQSTTTDEKRFFRDLKMSAYVPVVADSRLIGLLSSGPKTNDTPYNREDVELLAVIGQQVGTALRSARLIDDLQHLNDSMRVLNKRLENAKKELEKLDSIKTDFITIASHELRTPLAQIRGYTDIIDSLNDASALQKENTTQMVGNLRKSTERMEELISAMLDVSQIDVNSMDLRFVRTSADIIVKMALEPLRDPAMQRNITIERQEVTGLPNLEADLQRMVQAFRNLILNAIKFTPDGGKITIGASLEKGKKGEADMIRFMIQDTGVGIAPKDLEFIFNKFYRGFDTQLHSTGIYKFMGAGPGLGLTIAKGIIEGHGGRIWVESPGHDMKTFPGSTFYVLLPLQPPSGTRRVLPFEEDNRTPLSTDLGNMSDTAPNDPMNQNTRIPPSR